MPELNIRRFYEDVAATYHRYLFTAHFLPDNEPELKRAFWQALKAANMVCREPLLTILPAYAQGLSALDLMGRKDGLALHKAFSRMPIEHFDPKRRLYRHQVEAITKAREGNNIIVASGTGSGKTECFLFPALDDALRQTGPGVRAIVVYPMNALANDQLGRMRGLLSGLPEVTFGRYTGDTPNDRGDDDDEGILEPNERFSRKEIRSAPPHILLTNFAMLEYLLLRPQDADVFRHQKLRYVILDEAHTYSGAQGIEVGLLMRRLQEAFSGCKLQFILTSATLGNDKVKIAEFGHKLSGAVFYESDVILGEVVHSFDQDLAPLINVDQCIRTVPNESTLNEWIDALEDLNALKGLALRSGIPVPAEANAQQTPSAFLGMWLSRSRELSALHEIASAGPLTLSGASEYLWHRNDEDANRVAEWLVILGANAKLSSEHAALLPARYHVFFRGLQGGTVCLSRHCLGRKDHPNTRWSTFVLEDRNTCPVCSEATLPLLSCVHCGFPVVRVFRRDDKWQTARPPTDVQAVLLSWRDERGDTQEEDDAQPGTVELCQHCRSISLDGPLEEQCCAAPNHLVLSLIPSDESGNVRECPFCSRRNGAFPSVFREFATGEDAATAVIAEAVIRCMPPDGTGNAKPAGGRQLLAFSDSRQRAAHFAPYLERTTAETEYMQPLVQTIEECIAKSEGGCTSFDEVADRFQQNAKKQPYVVIRRTAEEDGEYTANVKVGSQLSYDDRRILRKECLISLLDQFTSSPRARTSLPGLGIASVVYDWTEEQRSGFPERLSKIFASGEQQGFAILQNLVHVFLWRRSLVLPDDIRLGHLMAQGPKEVTFRHKEAGRIEGRDTRRWNAYYAVVRKDAVVKRSPQVQMVATLLGLEPMAGEGIISSILDDVWTAFRDFRVIRPHHDHRNEFQVHYEDLLIIQPKTWHVCLRCGALTPVPMAGRCCFPGCAGIVAQLEPSELATRMENNHWFHRFTRSPALPLVVKEHTAQLENKAAADYQRGFLRREINLLSSSTTFEMGVDVGQLQSVFLRNVPPTSANYIQRAGRAGRRREGTAYAITYSRSMPHDQVHFHVPEKIVNGRVPVPRINLANPRLTQRHINSFLLGKFMKDENIRGEKEQLTVQEFFLKPNQDTAPSVRYSRWIASHQAALLHSVRNVIDPTCDLDPDSAIAESSRSLIKAREDFEDQLRAYDERCKEIIDLIQTGEHRMAGALQIVSRLADDMRTERLIDHLASAHWLPSYAFPQDVLKLRTLQPDVGKRLRLERDAEYAISEYAPGSEVVVDGKVLTSRAVDLRNKEMDIRWYRACTTCNQVQEAVDLQDLGMQCRYCGAPKKPKKYIEPKGFMTLYRDTAPAVKFSRLRPPASSQVFLIEGAALNSFIQHPKVVGVSVGYCRTGRLFRANSGRERKQFWLCRFCGRGFDRGGSKEHEKPWGSKCSGRTPVQVDLVCQFTTETLQVRFDKTAVPAPEVGNRTFWTSFRSAFVAAAAEVLYIPRSDLDATYRSQSEGSFKGELVVYDRVPGGAGYVFQIQEHLDEILKATLESVQKCPNPNCDSNGSCYSCLRSFRNQFEWEDLSREAVSVWLSQIVPKSAFDMPASLSVIPSDQ